MREIQLMSRAAEPFIETIGRIEPHQLTAATPCPAYDVRGLVNHLLFWGPSLEGAARKEAVPPPAQSDMDVDLTDGDWYGSLSGHVERTVTAWSDPGAWAGATFVGGPTELPASLIGGMAVGELVVHGWDLARATGQDPTWDTNLLEFLHTEVAANAEQGREMGVYGPEVDVPVSAPTMDRILGLTGRDPGWSR